MAESHTDLLEILQRALARYPEIQLAILFGSQARQRPRFASDIDLAVCAPGADLQALSGDLASELGGEVHVVSLETATLPVLEALIQDGIIVAPVPPGVRKPWRSRRQIDHFYRRMRDAWLRRVAERGL